MTHRLSRILSPLRLLAGAAICAAASACDSQPAGPMNSSTVGQDTAVAVIAPSGPAADVRFTIDSRSATPISPFIYGVNVGYENGWYGATLPDNLTLGRIGGNRMSAYNWENNASNAGSDYRYQNDGFMSSSATPGEGVRRMVQKAFDRGSAVLMTVPMLGYVAADKDGPVGTDPATLATRLATRFRESRARKGSAFSLTPDATDGAVYQDEFVWWLNQKFPQAQTDAQRTLLYGLDNEPDIWHKTHEEVRSKVNGEANLLGYDELVQKTIAHAAAVKDVVPGATVMAPGFTNWSGMSNLGRGSRPDPMAGSTDFVSYYLGKMRDAERTTGRRLLDALDLHWYTEVVVDGKRLTDDRAPQTPATVEARLQAPRSLWDPTYTEKSWIIDVTRGPIRLLPRLRDKIATYYPGTKIAITEYYYGRGGDISGGIAQADALGIFGREGVYAATVWPAAQIDAYGGDGNRGYAFLFGAFRMFRDYDGRRGSFGNTSITASTTDVEKTSVYASVDAGRDDRVVVVAINKTSAPLTAEVGLTHSRALGRAEIYTLTADSPMPARQADLPLPDARSFRYTMPPMSVSTLVLR